MKHAATLLAVFLSLTTAAQQTGFPIKNELPAYKPVKFDLHKKLKSPEQSYINDNLKLPDNFSFAKNETTVPGFKTLRDNLADDRHFFKLEQRNKEWTSFSSGLLHTYSSSYTRQSWFENRNHVQQRWMAQKMKGKQ